LVKFKRYPTVWIFSTGDELENISGYIRDTNSVMIKQILEQDHYKGQVFNFGIVRDKYVNVNICNTSIFLR
jgi:molybdopterin biosynthesis enzyme